MQTGAGLIRAIFREKLARVDRMSTEETAVEWFERVIKLMHDETRNRHQEIDADGIEAEIDWRLPRSRELDNILRPVDELVPQR